MLHVLALRFVSFAFSDALLASVLECIWDRQSVFAVLPRPRTGRCPLSLWVAGLNEHLLYIRLVLLREYIGIIPLVRLLSRVAERRSVGPEAYPNRFRKRSVWFNLGINAE